ncbi:MAG: hypothetical protein VR65_11760 [Desulfobulbaceae bacterium BRH_c16a]|nr:MAG: hypothetical protein VR65_11760 [Desulfobulbaceae bacterium BRH_c16a]
MCLPLFICLKIATKGSYRLAKIYQEKQIWGIVQNPLWFAYKKGTSMRSIVDISPIFPIMFRNSSQKIA